MFANTSIISSYGSEGLNTLRDYLLRTAATFVGFLE